MESTKRTVTCGELRASDIGKVAVLNGWVHRTRDMGGIFFLLVRDRYGITQVTVGDGAPEDVKQQAAQLKNEYCIAVRGTVIARAPKDVNKDMPTGEIEVLAEAIEIFTSAEQLPFAIDEVRQKDGTIVLPHEDLRLTYRYLDLRREPMKRNIVLRSRVTFAVREYLTQHNFLEIETPTFVKSTPEGARDYLVPSRIHPGKFYSLPQSPQLYKQLLMVSGFDRYFQIARCYRDEDARGDRQPEFTQIDMEMSFTDREEVLTMTEGMMRHVFKTTLNVDIPAQFERLSWDDAFNRYGTDKPDTRFDLIMQDAAFMAALSDFNAFREAVAGTLANAENADDAFPPVEKSATDSASGAGAVAIETTAGTSSPGKALPTGTLPPADTARGAIKALVVKGAAEAYSRKKIEALEEKAKIYKAKGLAWMKVSAEKKFEGGIAKFFAGQEDIILPRLGADAGDLLLFVADKKWKVACTALGAVRVQLGKDLNVYDSSKKFAFVWIIDFPYFSWNEDENKWETEHHMFTLPQKQYWPTLESNPAAVKGDLYDLVLNGYELASGSMRINDPALQERVFNIVGYSKERAAQAFGFLVDAFKFGAPPHGGIAPGLDRLVMIMCGETSIKEVIAFPKNTLAQSPMDGCPSVPAEKSQLSDLHISVTVPAK